MINQTSSPTPSTPVRLGPAGPLLISGGRQGQYATVLYFQNLSGRQEKILNLITGKICCTEQLELISSRLDALQAQKIKAPKSRQDFLSQRIKLAEKELETLMQQQKQARNILLSPHIIFDSIALTKKVDPEPKVKALLEVYEKNIPALVAQCEATINCPSAEPNTPTYVGVQTCKNCHAPAYEVWQKAVFTNTGHDEEGKTFKRTVGHSKAWATLKRN